MLGGGCGRADAGGLLWHLVVGPPCVGTRGRGAAPAVRCAATLAPKAGLDQGGRSAWGPRGLCVAVSPDWVTIPASARSDPRHPRGLREQRNPYIRQNPVAFCCQTRGEGVCVGLQIRVEGAHEPGGSSRIFRKQESSRV